MKLAAVVVLGLGGCADSIGPHLDSVTPARAPRGGSVELAGQRFCGAAPNCTNVSAKVEIGLAPPIVQANVLAYSPTSATIQIPPAAPVGPTSLVLTVAGRSSNALDFEVQP